MKRMEKPLDKERLANGVTVRFHDLSRKVAGDRWQVVVRYDVVAAIPESFWGLVSGDQALIGEVRAALGPEIVLSRTMERNFIGEPEKEELVNEMVRRIRENMLAYFADDGFAERFFLRRFKEVRGEIELKKNVANLPVDEECDEPDDFSHVFRKI